MAFEVNDINTGVRKSIIPVVIDTIFKDILIFHLLQKRNKVTYKGVGPDGYIDQPIIVGKYPTHSHDNRFGKLSVDVVDILGSAKFRFATQYGSIPLTRDDEKKLKSTDAVLDVLKVRFEALTTSLIEDIEKQLFQQFSVTEGVPISSLQQMVDNGDVYPEYAGVPRATVEGFKSFTKDLGGAGITYPALMEAYQEAKHGNEHPTICFTTLSLWRKINELIYNKQQQQVYKDDYLYQLGIENFKIFTAPCVDSSFMPDGQILFLNENYLTLALDNSGDEKGFTFDDYKRVDLATVKSAQLFWDGQLFGIPRYHSKIINAV